MHKSKEAIPTEDPRFGQAVAILRDLLFSFKQQEKPLEKLDKRPPKVKTH